MKPKETGEKVLSPEIIIIALGQGFYLPEASIAACVKGESVSDAGGSEARAGIRTVDIGTWENHIVPHRSFQQAEEARRRYGGMVVGLTRIRGVAGVMPGGACSSLEGVSSKTPRDEEAYAIR